MKGHGYIDLPIPLIHGCVNMIMPRFLFLLLSGSVLCCSPKEQTLLPQLAITGFTLSSTNPLELARWYQTNLGFEIESNEAELTLQHEEITLGIEEGEAMSQETETKTRRPGFFKIGFRVPNLDTLYQRLQTNSSDFRGGIFEDSKLQTRSLVALDTDGNRVQFFEDSRIDSLQPYFFSVMALDFEATKAWCESELGLIQIHKLDLPERGLSIRLMEKDGVLLELIGDEGLQQNEASKTGIAAIHFNQNGKRSGTSLLRYNGL